MRLKYVFIKEYKNLKDFDISFYGSSFIDVFVGKNGSGKSNFFEALIEIFDFLHNNYTDTTIKDFKIIYEIDSTEISIEWKDKKKFVSGGEKSFRNIKLPDNVIVYYSGHNKQVSKLLEKYEAGYKSNIQKAEVSDSRFFIGVGTEYKEILLSILLLSMESKAKNFICEKLNIETIDETIFLTLKRPYFADKKFVIENFDPLSHFWGAKGITKIFLDKLILCVKGEFLHSDIYNLDKDTYTIPINIELFQEKFRSESIENIFKQIDNLKTLEMYDNIHLALKLKNQVDANLSYFSDGQFQSIYIYTIMEIFKDLDCVTLLDEPDAFLHPEWQFKFLEQVYEITNATAKKNHVLMSSHSAITLMNYQNKNIRMFTLESNQIKNRNVNKKYAVDQLSSNLLKYREDEQILSILRNINIERLPILFTEGSTDPDIIRVAWEKLYSEPMPFISIYAFKCDYLRQLIQDQRIQNELRNKAIFALFDFDEAYNEWNHLKSKDTWNDFETDPYKGLCTGIESKKTYAFVIPVPEIEQIERQVIIDKTHKTHYAHESKMEIEHLFYNAPNTSEYFEIITKPGGAEIIEVKTSKKTKFAKEVVSEIDASYFEVLKPMLDFIKSKCEGN